MSLSSLNHSQSRRIVEILIKHSNLSRTNALLIAMRVDYCGEEKVDKMLSFLTGTLVNLDYQDKYALNGISEYAMFYSNGKIEVAYEIVEASPIADEYGSEEELKRLIVDHWEDMGANTFLKTVGTIRNQQNGQEEDADNKRHEP